jgi:beta-xylosidase
MEVINRILPDFVVTLFVVVDTLSFWPFSDLFEEAGLYGIPYNYGYGMPVDGLMNVYGTPKPNYRAFQLLVRISFSITPIFVTQN